MCLSATGRDELINHITIQNVLAVIQVLADYQYIDYICF
jgi:hypothetical protein